jgi:hypothetical protein
VRAREWPVSTPADADADDSDEVVCERALFIADRQIGLTVVHPDGKVHHVSHLFYS